jgi:nitrogen fixation NifU-like protein
MTTKNPLYSPHLLEHYHRPRHKGILVKADFVVDLTNVSCGDAIRWYGVVKNGLLDQCAFQGNGCIISQAAASMLADYAIGKPLNMIMQCDEKTMLTLLALELGPTRLRCATLPLEALCKGLDSYAQTL